MKANNLTKTSITAEEIYEGIDSQLKNNPSCFKHYIPHFLYVSDEVKLQLIDDGFKVYKGAWDGIQNDGLIIEW
jgi:hypothetical protein